MTALNDASVRRPPTPHGTLRRALPVRCSRRACTRARIYPAWLPSRRFISAVIAIGGMQLLATMDSTVAIVALPKIQDELNLSDAGRSWVITAYVLTFGGLMLLGRPARRHHRAQADLHRRRRAVHHRLDPVRNRLGRDDSGDRPAAAGRRRGDRLADRAGAGRHHLPQGPGSQRGHRGLRRDDRYRLGDGPGRRRRADRGVLAAGVPGQRADRPADDLPGPHTRCARPTASG